MPMERGICIRKSIFYFYRFADSNPMPSQLLEHPEALDPTNLVQWFTTSTGSCWRLEKCTNQMWCSFDSKNYTSYFCQCRLKFARNATEAADRWIYSSSLENMFFPFLLLPVARRRQRNAWATFLQTMHRTNKSYSIRIITTARHLVVLSVTMRAACSFDVPTYQIQDKLSRIHYTLHSRRFLSASFQADPSLIKIFRFD